MNSDSSFSTRCNRVATDSKGVDEIERIELAITIPIALGPRGIGFDVVRVLAYLKDGH